MKKEFPILEYDSSVGSIFNPSDIIRKKINIPENCVLTFFNDVIEHFNSTGMLRKIFTLKSELGEHPLYEFEINNSGVVLFNPGVGAPLAAAHLEELIALGCRNFIACGGAGVLDKNIAGGHLIIPSSAVRDEGTSYHYLPASREAKPSAKGAEKIKQVLDGHNIPYIITKTWTTDGVYRETRNKADIRKEEGCLVVEMEAAALFAVAEFRGVELAQLLYGGDNLDGEKWEDRDWQKNRSIREKLIWLAAEAVILM